MIKNILISVAILGLLACGKEKAQEEPPKDPAQAALKSFKDFTASTYPATTFERSAGNTTYNKDWVYVTECEIQKVDVVKSDSASSPYVGVLNGSGKETNTGPKQDDGFTPTGEVNKSSFKLKFTREGDTWKCDPAESSASTRGVGPCELVERFCRGKAVTPS